MRSSRSSVISHVTRMFLAVMLLAIASLALAQAPEATLTVSAPPKQVLAGSKLTLTLSFALAEGFHGYQNPPQNDYEIPVTVVVDGKEFKVLKIAYPAGVDATVGGMDKPTKAYEGLVKIPVTLLVPNKPGVRTIKFQVNYQQCNETTCFPPASTSKSVKVNVVKKAKG